MPQPALDETDARFDRFLDNVTAPLRNDSQRATFAEYVIGLLSDAERKSMEPLAAHARPTPRGPPTRPSSTSRAPRSGTTTPSDATLPVAASHRSPASGIIRSVRAPVVAHDAS